MTDKVAIITGSSSGIGEATAKLFLKNGYQVVITGSNSEKLDRVAAECKGLSPKSFEPLVVVADFRQPENVDIVLEKTIEKFGRLDVLVNNAGTFVKSLDDDLKNSYDAYRGAMSVNLDSTVRLTLTSVEHLRKTKGNIVNVSSVASIKPSDKAYAYCVSKAGMTMFSKCLAIDLAPDVRVNAVLPGPVATPLVHKVGLTEDIFRKFAASTCPVGRVGEADEIAKAIGYLASDDASFITGTDLVIDGGYVIKNSALTAIVRREQQ